MEAKSTTIKKFMSDIFDAKCDDDVGNKLVLDMLNKFLTEKQDMPDKDELIIGIELIVIHLFQGYLKTILTPTEVLDFHKQL